jgi:hypothetical protein
MTSPEPTVRTMRHALLIVAVLVGCAQRDEIIAIVPPGDGGGGGAPALLFMVNEAVDLGCRVSSVDVGNVDGDAILDVVAGGDCVALLRGTGAPPEFMPGLVGTFRLARIDTSHPDLASDPLDLIGGLDALVILSGQGDGSFTPFATEALAANLAMASAADLSGDGALEAVATFSTTVAVWPGHGAAGLGAPLSIDLGDAVAGHAIADVNGNGRNDLIVGGADLHVIINLGDAFAPAHGITDGRHAAAIAPGHFDGDGCIDLVTIDGTSGAPAPASGELRLFIGDCHGGFTLRTASPLGGATALAAADLDADGHLDAIVATHAGAITFHRGDGSGGFREPITIAVGTTALDVAVADLDGDAALDLIVAAGADGVVVVTRSR